MTMRVRVIVGAGLALLLAAVWAIGEKIPREPLDRLWEEHMLAGTYGLYSEGKRQEYSPEHSFEYARGSPDSAAILTKQGIAIADTRETRVLGLWRGGGWNLEGGLLARVEDRNSAFELYGKRVTWIQPFFILNIWAWHSPKVDFSYEFFLLHRKKGPATATILMTWVFRPGQLDRDYPPNVQGYLKYDPGRKAAMVAVTGLKFPFEERVDLSRALRD